MTPERKIKKRIKFLLDNAFPVEYPCYYETLVTGGYGRVGLDFSCCMFGQWVSIEAKAPGSWLEPRQRLTALNVLKAGGKVFIVSGDEGLAALKNWIFKTGVGCLH